MECHVILSDFSDTDLPIVIHSRGWESLCDILVTCPFVIIQEFYSNMHKIDILVPHFFSRVRGTLIVVTSEIVSEVLHVPRVVHLDYLATSFCQNFLTLTYPLSFTAGVGSHFVTSRSLVPP